MLELRRARRVATLKRMVTTDEPEPTPPTSANSSPLPDPEYPRLRPDTEDEQELAEGESELTFFAPPPKSRE